MYALLFSLKVYSWRYQQNKLNLYVFICSSKIEVNTLRAFSAFLSRMIHENSTLSKLSLLCMKSLTSIFHMVGSGRCWYFWCADSNDSRNVSRIHISISYATLGNDISWYYLWTGFMLQLPGQLSRVKVNKVCITFGMPSSFLF